VQRVGAVGEDCSDGPASGGAGADLAIVGSLKSADAIRAARCTVFVPLPHHVSERLWKCFRFHSAQHNPPGRTNARLDRPGPHDAWMRFRHAQTRIRRKPVLGGLTSECKSAA